MDEIKKESGFMDMVKDGLKSVTQMIVTSVFAPLTEGTDAIMKSIEHRIIHIERRIMYDVSSFLIIGFGGVLLTFALLSYVKEVLGWSNYVALFSIGIVVIIIGIFIKQRSLTYEKNNR